MGLFLVVAVAGSGVAAFLLPILMRLAGAPGAFLYAGRDRPSLRFAGILLSLAGQLGVALLWLALSAHFTAQFAKGAGWWGLLLWSLGFIGALLPFGFVATAASKTEIVEPSRSLEAPIACLCMAVAPTAFCIFGLWSWLGHHVFPGVQLRQF